MVLSGLIGLEREAELHALGVGAQRKGAGGNSDGVVCRATELANFRNGRVDIGDRKIDPRMLRGFVVRRTAERGRAIDHRVAGEIPFAEIPPEKRVPEVSRGVDVCARNLEI